MLLLLLLILLLLLSIINYYYNYCKLLLKQQFHWYLSSVHSTRVGCTWRCVLTKSTPFRRWIPTNVPAGRESLIKRSAFFSMAADQCMYFWSFQFCLSTGKAPGAPMKARTGNLDLGNLEYQNGSLAQTVSHSVYTLFTISYRAGALDRITFFRVMHCLQKKLVGGVISE